MSQAEFDRLKATANAYLSHHERGIREFAIAVLALLDEYDLWCHEDA